MFQNTNTNTAPDVLPSGQTASKTLGGKAAGGTQQEEGGNGCSLLPLPPNPAASPREGRASSGAKQQRLAEELGVQLLRKHGSGACPA